MYVNLGNGSLFCKSVYYSNRFTAVTNSIYGVNGIFGVNKGVPVAVWNSVTNAAYSQYPVPYYLQGQDGNTTNSQVIYLGSIYDGPNPQITLAAPQMFVDTNLTMIGDSSDLFAKDVIPLFPVSASQEDLDGTVSQYHIVTNGVVDIRVKVAATQVASFPGNLYTYVSEVDDITNVACPVPLAISTFRLKAIGSTNLANAVYMTFIKNGCMEFSVGLLHGIVGTFGGGGVYPPPNAPVAYQWTPINMIGLKGQGCPIMPPDVLLSDLSKSFFDDIYAAQSVMMGNTVATLGLLPGGALPSVTPGTLTSAQRQTVITSASEAMVTMWNTVVTDFNAYILSLQP